VRLRGIDAPEMKTDNRNEYKIACLAKEKLAKKIFNEIVELREVGTDKYGRLLCYVFFNGRCMSKWLLKNRLAVEYDGGTKKCPKNWVSYYRYKPIR